MIEVGPRDLQTSEEAVRLAMSAGTLILRDLGMDTRAVLEWIGRVGDAMIHPYRANVDEMPEVVVIDGHIHRAGVWHADETFLPSPPDLTVLSMKAPSATGGESEWIDLREAWRTLPDSLRDSLTNEELTCLHTTPDGDSSFTHQLMQTSNGSPYPFANRLYCTRLSAPSDDCDPALLPELLLRTESSPSHLIEMRAGDLALWNNRATIHRARPYSSRRRIERLSFRLRDPAALES